MVKGKVIASTHGRPSISKYFNIVNEAKSIRVMTKITCVSSGLCFI